MVDSQFSQYQASYLPFQVPPQQNEESIDLEKGIEALLESKKQFENMMDLLFSLNFQNTAFYPPFQVPPQPNEELIGLEKIIKDMI